MARYANIICHRYYNNGMKYVTYEWEGHPGAMLLVSNSLLDGFDPQKMPWPLLKISDDEIMGAALYIRTDVRLWWVTEARHRARDAWNWFYYRLIYTAQVWGLARVSPTSNPSWRDLFRKQ